MKLTSLLVLLLATTAFAQAWEGEYIPSKSASPQKAKPAWRTRVASAGTEAKVEGDVLIINTGAVDNGRLAFEQKEGWNGLPGSEVEAEVRVVAPLESRLPVAQIILSGPQGWQSLSIGKDYVVFTGKQRRYQLDLSTFQKLNLRFTREGTVELRVNDESEPKATAPLITENALEAHTIIFGDNSTTKNVGGTTEWKSLRWKRGTL